MNPSRLLAALSAAAILLLANLCFAQANQDSNEQASMAQTLSQIPRGVPVVMLNMLRFRESADYEEGSESMSGEEAYQIYREAAAKLVAKVGGETVWKGQAKAGIIAPEGERWDEVFLVRYPSIESFLKMVSSEEYQQIVKHRTAALADSRLIANVEPESKAK